MIFGESNNNIIQAHGSIDIAYPTTGCTPGGFCPNQSASGSETSGDPYAGASTCPFAGFYLGDRVGACRTYLADALPVDPTLPLQITPSIDNFGPNYTATGTFAFTATTVTRSDGLSWADFGFARGQTLEINGVEVGMITGVTYNGTTSVLTLTGSPLPFVGCASSCAVGATLVITDGESYVEGGRGNNTIFANQGQNDIVGGNSDMFSLRLPSERASGSNLIFGGSGSTVGYEECSFGALNVDNQCVTNANQCVLNPITNQCVLVPQNDGHAHDSNVLTANNADVVRLAGANGSYGAAPTGGSISALGYLEYNYDLASYPTATERIIPRAVTPLDNTPGGPDLAGQPGPLVTGGKATNGVGDIGGNPVPAGWGGNGEPAGALQQGSEIHAESGDAFIYGGPADDMIFGGAQNDTIITGYGDNWVSGGRGDQCVIGGGGRCLVSANGFSEPLNGVFTGIAAASLNQLITTPGNAQEATINVTGAFNYDALLYPYNWDPATWAAPGISNGSPSYSTNCKENQVCPVYETNYGHNIIYGGWGNGVVHGGPGDSAISGAEAPTLSYADNFNMYGNTTQAQYLSTGVADTVVTDYVLNKAPIETDFFHPFNPGNAAGYMPITDPPNGNQGRGFNIGKSLYFNAEDPRREILLFPGVIDPNVTSDGLLPGVGLNPLDCEWAPGASSTPTQAPVCVDATAAGLPFFLAFNPTDPNLPLDTTWFTGTGDPQMPVTGDKAIFGDLGNSYIVAGMGRARVYGGWGFDLIDLRASTYEDGGLNDGPVPDLTVTTTAGKTTFSVPPGAGTVFGTPAWESLAFGGAGQDIFFAGTGGDRLIDWVGNHNSYYVPFSQFGMPAVSRTLMPFLPEFLYALSKSDGADQTLGLRSDVFCASTAASSNAACSPADSGTAARNGEPFGELGLVLQHDAAWHQQSGAPFNEMPENLGGVGIDVQKTANVLPFNSSGTCDYLGVSAACAGAAASASLSLPSGAGVNLPSGTNSPGAGSVPLRVTGAPGAAVTYKFAEGTSVVTGSGVIGPNGTFGANVNLSGFADGTITVTITETGGGAPNKTLTGQLGKNSVAPPAPTASAATYANISNVSIYNVTVTGQAGSIANVTVADSALPIANLSNGMDFVGSKGSVVIPLDVTGLLDGPITITVTLTNGAGNSFAYTFTTTKDTTPPPLSVSPQTPYIGPANASAWNFTINGEYQATVSYTFSDGTTTIAGGKTQLPSSAKQNQAPNLTSLKDGNITLTVTETEVSGNVSVSTMTIVKKTTPPAVPTIALNPASDSGTSNSDYITNITTPHFNVTASAGTTTVVYLNGVAYTGQTLANGNYTITAISTDQYGNVSATATAPKTLVISTTPPSGSFTVAGAKTVSGQLTTTSTTPTLNLSFSDAVGIATMAVSTNGGATFGAAVAYAATAKISLANGNGLYTIVVKLTDVAGNVANFTVTVKLAATTAAAMISAAAAPIGTAALTGADAVDGPATVGSAPIASSSSGPKSAPVAPAVTASPARPPSRA
jgi:hypothetical protein